MKALSDCLRLILYFVAELAETQSPIYPRMPTKLEFNIAATQSFWKIMRNLLKPDFQVTVINVVVRTDNERKIETEVISSTCDDDHNAMNRCTVDVQGFDADFGEYGVEIEVADRSFSEIEYDATIKVVGKIRVVKPRDGQEIHWEERRALMDMFKDLDGNDWTRRDRWEDGDPCLNSWYGVWCRESREGAFTVIGV